MYAGVVVSSDVALVVRCVVLGPLVLLKVGVVLNVGGTGISGISGTQFACR
jgi:hypothetical protein